MPQALDHAGENVPPPPQAILSSGDTRLSLAGQTEPTEKIWTLAGYGGQRPMTGVGSY